MKFTNKLLEYSAEISFLEIDNDFFVLNDQIEWREDKRHYNNGSSIQNGPVTPVYLIISCVLALLIYIHFPELVIKITKRFEFFVVNFLKLISLLSS